MSGKIVAEDVPNILARVAAGERKKVIADEYGVMEGMIMQVVRGWMPRTRADINDLRKRQQLTKERGRKTQMDAPKPTERRVAYDAVFAAVANGSLVRLACHCGNPNTQAHHPNGYGQEHKLDVVWLCDQHHRETHVLLRGKHTSRRQSGPGV